MRYGGNADRQSHGIREHKVDQPGNRDGREGDERLGP